MSRTPFSPLPLGEGARVRELARRINEIEANERPGVQPTIPVPLPLPGGGLPGGALVEVLSAAEGGGAWTLALLLAKAACAEHKMLIIADGRRCFYPPAASALGVDLQRTLILQAQPDPLRGSARQINALVQSLRCPAVGAAIGRFERLTSAEYRSLQLAAETGGGVGFLVRPASAGAPSFAAVRLLVTPIASGQASRRIEVEVLRVRGGKAGQRFVLAIDHETGHVRVPAGVAAATSDARSA